LDLWLDVKAFPSSEGLLVCCRDVSEIAKIKQQLEKLSLVASQANIGVLIHDAAGKIEWVNEGFTQNTGFSLEEALGKRPAEFLHTQQTDTKAYELVQEEMRKGQPVSFELLIGKKSGEQAWHYVQVNPIFNLEGKLVNFVGTQTDINALKRSEIQMSKLAHDLCRQNQDLQQFSYIVSHNLRAPLSNALGLVDMLKSVGKDSEEFDTTLDYLKTSIDHLDLVLRDLNLILSIRDKKAFRQQQVDLKLKCRQALASHQESLDACQAQVRVNLPDELWVHDVNDYVYSILYNLIANAIKFRSPGRPLEIQIGCLGQSAAGQVIAFSDNGLGFDIQKAGPGIFKLYQKFHPGTEGRGIGLFLAKSQVEALGGQIEVTSQVDVGTRFLIHFT
jgi:PAS domain S-box-containing protein